MVSSAYSSSIDHKRHHNCHATILLRRLAGREVSEAHETGKRGVATRKRQRENHKSKGRDESSTSGGPTIEKRNTKSSKI